MRSVYAPGAGTDPPKPVTVRHLASFRGPDLAGCFQRPAADDLNCTYSQPLNPEFVCHPG